MATENTKSLMFEMRVMNDIRKLTPEQRKEIMNTIQTEEQLEEEALKKNPNLHLERNMQLVLGELKELRNEIKNIKAQMQNNKIQNTHMQNTHMQNDMLMLDTLSDDYEDYWYSEWLPFIIFVLFVLFSFLGKSSNF
jgi:hypothetical protein